MGRRAIMFLPSVYIMFRFINLLLKSLTASIIFLDVSISPPPSTPFAIFLGHSFFFFLTLDFYQSAGQDDMWSKDERENVAKGKETQDPRGATSSSGWTLKIESI